MRMSILYGLKDKTWETIMSSSTSTLVKYFKSSSTVYIRGTGKILLFQRDDLYTVTEQKLITSMSEKYSKRHHMS